MIKELKKSTKKGISMCYYGVAQQVKYAGDAEGIIH